MSEKCKTCGAPGATQRYKDCGSFYCALHHEANRVMCTSVDDGRSLIPQVSMEALWEISKNEPRKTVRIAASREIIRRHKAAKKGTK